MRECAQRLAKASAIFVVLLVGCDRVGRENGRNSAVPQVAPPRLSPTELKAPIVDRQVLTRVKVVDPPLVDATQTDLLKQSDGVVDILWVVDDSGSMANERKILVGNFNRFVQELQNLKVDFQMGVTSVSALDFGQLRGMTPIIKNTTPDLRAVFETNTTFLASRARWEQGLRMAEFALTAPRTSPGGTNAGFIRPQAALAVIVVTNEDDSSFGDPDYYARAFRSLKGKGNENLVTYSVIGGPTPNGCTPPTEAGLYGSLASPAFRYADVATKTGGVVGSICDLSFEQTLIKIAQALNTLKRVFPLTIRPLISSLRVSVLEGASVTVIPEDPVRGYQYKSDSNSVVFLGSYVPPPGSTVRLEYAFAKE
jgi:hypothetical protein